MVIRINDTMKRNLIEVMDLLATANPDKVITIDGGSARLLFDYITILRSELINTGLVRKMIRQQEREKIIAGLKSGM